ncbi:hypothetical protein [Hymenobacter bucti]|uniref:Uncharacterized protein n=1 Tax=Hymenobacter bucti TaxID=1844114 RepID=A0ABW4QU15_9BACT
MLDFYTIRDDQAASARGLQLHLIGGIEEEEFEAAVAAGVIEPHLDYYGNFRWSSKLVNRKLTLLEKLNNKQFEKTVSILEQAKAAESGLITRGD